MKLYLLITYIACNQRRLSKDQYITLQEIDVHISKIGCNILSKTLHSVGRTAIE